MLLERKTCLVETRKACRNNNNNNNNNTLFHPIQEIKIYNNSTDDDMGSGCPK